MLLHFTLKIYIIVVKIKSKLSSEKYKQLFLGILRIGKGCKAGLSFETPNFALTNIN